MPESIKKDFDPKLAQTLLDGVVALLGGRLRGFLTSQRRARIRITGSFLIGAGLGLALARRA